MAWPGPWPTSRPESPAPRATGCAPCSSGLRPAAARAGCLGELEAADRLVTANGSERQRQVAAEEGLEGLMGSLADRFLATET